MFMSGSLPYRSSSNGIDRRHSGASSLLDDDTGIGIIIRFPTV